MGIDTEDLLNISRQGLTPLSEFSKTDILKLKNYKISHLTLPLSVFTVKTGASVLETLVCMDMLNVGSTVITDDSDGVVGILTERDVLRKIAGKTMDFDKELIDNYMDSEPVITTINEGLTEVIHKFEAKRCRYMVVLNDSGDLHSILSAADIISFLSHRLIQASGS